MLFRNVETTADVGGIRGTSRPGNVVRAQGLAWAVAGARGGTGKSLIAAHLGADLAGRGWQVLLADLDWDGGTLRTLLGGEPAEVSVTDIAEGRGPDTPSALPMVRTGLRLIPGVSGFFDAPDARARADLLEVLRRMPCHHLVMDLGAGREEHVTGPFLASDVPLLVTVPDPVGVENTYRFLGGLVRQQTGALLTARGGGPDDALESLRPVRSLEELERKAGEVGAEAVALADQVRRSLAGRPIYLVLNQVRRLGDLDVANGLEQVARRTFGCELRTIGAVQYDERVWIAMRKGHGVAEWGPVSGLGDDMKELVDALLMELGLASDNRAQGVALVDRYVGNAR